MLRLQRLAAEGVRQHDVVVLEDLEREVRRVALLAVREDEASGRLELRPAEDRLDRDTLPGRIQPRPTRHAVDVAVDRLAGETLELLPGERELALDLAVDLEVPLRKVRAGNRAVMQHGELERPVLAGRNPVGDLRVLLMTTEQPLEHRPSNL